MNESAINELHQNIIKLLRRRQLKEALTQIRDFLGDASNWELSGELERIELSYRLMLKYMRQNVTDPDRKKMYIKLLTDTFSLVDRIRILKLQLVSTRYYYGMRNFLRTHSTPTIKSMMMRLESYTEEIAVVDLLQEETSDNAKHIRKRHEEAHQILFDLVWTNDRWKVEDGAEAKEMLQSVLLSLNDLCLFVSAVTMSLMECFDLRKLMWLFEAYEDERAQVNQRALVGLAFIFHLYHERMLLYPEIMARLSLLSENGHFADDLCRVQIQMLRTQETAKIDKKMREEIIPEVMKNVKPRNIKFDLDDSDEENDDRNPDWTHDFESSPLGDKLKEMSELQMEGADIYMTTFAQLKNYPFFKAMPNWFYPFDKQHSSIAGSFSKDQTPLLDMLLQAGFFCDSDKYSMCFTARHIPKSQIDAMIGQLSEQQMNEFMDEQKSSSMKKHFDRPESISNQYLHNLYRFFKLFPSRHEFRDIFNEPLRLYRYTILQSALNKTEYLYNIADYLFGKEYLSEAARVYETSLELGGDNAEIYQKLGFCRQKEQRYNEAIEAYLKSDMIKPDNVWTNRHLATCYRIMHEFDKALEYYHKVEEVQPENKNILFYIGSCLAELERCDEALNYFFKLDFLEANNLKAWRAIGWCSFITGKHEQAMKYYQQVLEHTPKAPDYMNAGHVAWTSGDIEKTIELYTKSIGVSKNKEEFLRMFHKDENYLIQQGIHADDIPLLLDLL